MPCRAGTDGGGSQQQQPGGGGGKRKLLAVSSTFSLPGEGVPAHMMFGANKVPRLGGGGSKSSL